MRTGDNLFTCSVVALDPTTGKRKWHYQFTPNDTHDWDANEDLVLTDRVVNGVKRKVMLQADRNGMFYVLDRTDGKLIMAKPYVRQTWNTGFSRDGKPLFAPGWKSSPEGNTVYPSLVGGSNWQSPSFDGARATLFVAARDSGMGYRSAPVNYEAGRQYLGGTPMLVAGQDKSGIIAINVDTGDVRWRFPLSRMSAAAGVLATASGVLFVSTAEGNLIALDSVSGKSLWHFQTGAGIAASPMSYAVDGKQFVAVSAGNVLYSFALPD